MSHKPRILCLHGGGVSAEIFRLQFRYFLTRLEPHFRLVFVDGPFSSEMHEDLRPFYSEMGPCHRWSRWLPHHPPLDNESAIAEIEDSLTNAMDADQGTGKWVGLIGFSQGAKLAFSVLLENQLRHQENPWAPGFAGVKWEFGVIMAGRAPPYSLSHRTARSKNYVRPGELAQEHEYDYAACEFSDKLRIPTLHVHGMRDPGLKLHQHLLRYFCDPANTRTIEWDGGHRIPFRPADVELVTDGIFKIAKVQRLDAPYNKIPSEHHRGFPASPLALYAD
ncbi:hypothetical protein MMC22_011658 [Lobaria immixta]|nr:hypothetical protein [Lobaria immixta]